jgi:glycosyltransferase involved in cell wall biosynthesis
VERFKKININTIMITNYPIVGKNKEKNENAVNTICFAGGISEQWNHDKIIKAIENIDEIEYLLAGNGTDEYIKLLKSLPGWDKVNYVGKIPHADVKDLYSKSVAGMALNYSNQAKGEGTLGNTKIFEYMETGLPIICTNYKLWQEIIDEYECGICVNPTNENEIAAAISFIVNNKDKARKMGQEGRRAIKEKFNWKVEEKKLLELYEYLNA